MTLDEHKMTLGAYQTTEDDHPTPDDELLTSLYEHKAIDDKRNTTDDEQHLAIDIHKLLGDEDKRLVVLLLLLEDEVVRTENSSTFAANKHALYLLTGTGGALL